MEIEIEWGNKARTRRTYLTFLLYAFIIYPNKYTSFSTRFKSFNDFLSFAYTVLSILLEYKMSKSVFRGL